MVKRKWCWHFWRQRLRIHTAKFCGHCIGKMWKWPDAEAAEYIRLRTLRPEG